MNTWSGRKVQQARAVVAARLPMQCGRCDRIVDGSEPWVVGHIVGRGIRPDLMWDPANWQPEHRTCSDASGQAAVIEKARAEGIALAQAGLSSPEDAAGQPPPLPFSLLGGHGEPVEIPEGLSWASFVQAAPVWLAPHLVLPETANPPLAISPLHPDTVGSFALPGDRAVCPEGAIAWIERVEGKQLRWWQALGLILKLQHDEQGRLPKRKVVETGPRRAGKSVGLRGLALWRMQFGRDLFGERQEVVHTGSDLSVCRKAQKEAWRWAESMEWKVTRGNGKEAIDTPDDDVWLVRAQDATYGWDTTLALVDEGWDVKPDTVDEGLGPSLMGRQSPQLVLTSTSHRRARSTMRSALSTALLEDDPRTLLLWWGALPGADVSDPATWKAASPYWDEDRAEFVASMYAKALAGEQDPEFDDPDPMRGFACQYANLWTLKKSGAGRGEPVVDQPAWDRLVAEVPFAVPDAAAIESWFEDGVSLVLGWRCRDRVVVSATAHEDLASAVAALKASEFRGVTMVGASLVGDPALKGLATRAGEGRVGAAAAELRGLLREDVVRHDGQTHLAAQVLALRTIAGADGPRMASSERADAVKATAWVIRAARTGGTTIRRMVLPTSATSVGQ